jgi:hypothetical protein
LFSKQLFSPETFSTFMTRLNVERVHLEPSKSMGFTLLRMIGSFGLTPKLMMFVETDVCLASLAAAFDHYHVSSRKDEDLVLTAGTKYVAMDAPPPAQVAVPRILVERVVREAAGTLLCQFAAGSWKLTSDEGWDRLSSLPDMTKPTTDIEAIVRQLKSGK